MGSNRTELTALKNLLSQADRILETSPALPENRTGACRELLGTALALTDDLLKHSNLLARTLALKPNPDCYKQPVDTQFTCLTQSGSQSLLDDGHAQSIVSSLSNGPNSDLINAASQTQAEDPHDQRAGRQVVAPLAELEQHWRGQNSRAVRALR